MSGDNLIPAHRLDAKTRRRRTRQWTLASCAYAAALLAASGACYALLTHAGGDPAAEVRDTTDKIGRSRAAIASLQQQITQVQHGLEANRAVGNQPNWSVLLRVLSACLGDEIFLRRCQLGPQEGRAVSRSPGGRRQAGPAAMTTAGQRKYLLRLSGYGRRQKAVSQFVIRLEKHELFDKVRLIRTSREPLLADTAIAFHIECFLGH
jgi:hypothetical protein